MTYSDLKLRDNSGVFSLDSLTIYDYYPFGMLKPGRYYEDVWSRYGFNGQEKDDDIKGKGNSLDFGFRNYDTRSIRFYSIDPLITKYPYYSSYQFAGNNPIQFIDLDGLEAAKLTGSSNLMIVIDEEDGVLDEEKMKHDSKGWDYVVVKNIDRAKSLLQEQYGGKTGFINNLVVDSHGAPSRGPQLDSDFHVEESKNPIGNKSQEYVRSLLSNSATVLFTGCGIVGDFNNNNTKVKNDRKTAREVVLKYGEFYLKNSSRNLFFDESFTMGRDIIDEKTDDDYINGGDTWSINFDEYLVSTKSKRGTGFMQFNGYSEMNWGPYKIRTVLNKKNFYDIIIDSDGFLKFEKLGPVKNTPLRDNQAEKKK